MTLGAHMNTRLCLIMTASMNEVSKKQVEQLNLPWSKMSQSNQSLGANSAEVPVLEHGKLLCLIDLQIRQQKTESDRWEESVQSVLSDQPTFIATTREW